jgi:2-C-methyl-D-erythritol 4-phosphate cytidylyltransferase
LYKGEGTVKGSKQNLGVTVIILAGGVGSRLGKSIPKQYIEINGKTVLDRVVEKFKSVEYCKQIILCVNPQYFEEIKKKHADCTVTTGGESRHQSCINGFKKIKDSSLNILIHAAARPLVSRELILKSIHSLATYDASIPVIDSHDPILLCNGELQNVDRAHYKFMQTPEAFKYHVLEELYNKTPQKEAYTEYSLALDLQKCFFGIIPGEFNNIKITTNTDLLFVENVINQECL